MIEERRRPLPHRSEDAPSYPPAQSKGEEAQETKRRPSPIERRDWRGAGVCGDRHTD